MFSKVDLDFFTLPFFCVHLTGTVSVSQSFYLPIVIPRTWVPHWHAIAYSCRKFEFLFRAIIDTDSVVSMISLSLGKESDWHRGVLAHAKSKKNENTSENCPADRVFFVRNPSFPGKLQVFNDIEHWALLHSL